MNAEAITGGSNVLSASRIATEVWAGQFAPGRLVTPTTTESAKVSIGANNRTTLFRAEALLWTASR